MVLHKLFAFFLIAGLALPTVAAAQKPTPEAKSGKLTPELTRSAVQLLKAVERESQQFKLPENRVRAQTIVADLMWKHDERRARAIFQTVEGELQNMFEGIRLPEGTELNGAEKSRHYYERSKLAELRQDFVLTLASHDSKAAQAALAGLKTILLEEYDPLVTRELELKVTAVIVKIDPDKSYTVAKEQLDAHGVNSQLIETLENLHKKDSAFAAGLARDALAKIKNTKIRVPGASGSTAATDGKTETDLSNVSSFLFAALEMNRAATRDKAKKTVPLLAVAEIKELVELIAEAFLAESKPAYYSISRPMPEIKRYAPALAQRIRLKLGAEVTQQLEKLTESDAFYYMRKEKSAEELMKLAEASAPDVRDSRYSTAVFKAMDEDSPEKAQAIAARIKDRKNYTYLFDQLQAWLPLARARRGNLAEVRGMIATLKTNEERVATLTELASALAAKGEKETAKALLDESLQMMTPLLGKHRDLAPAANVVGVYAVASPEQAFTMIESGIGQVNEYINSGIKRDEFYDGGALESGELRIISMNSQALLYFPNSVELMKNLARADFERTVGLADKFERPEIRLFFRLSLARALLDPKAVEKVKSEREYLTESGEMN